MYRTCANNGTPLTHSHRLPPNGAPFLPPNPNPMHIAFSLADIAAAIAITSSDWTMP